MSSEPQVIGTTATQNSIERVLTRRQADQLRVYEVVERWLHQEPAFLHEDGPEHHLEELALMTVAAEWLTRWQPISMLPAPNSGKSVCQGSTRSGCGTGRRYAGRLRHAFAVLR